MLVKDAVVMRFQEICRERGMTMNEQTVRSGVTPSSVYSTADSRRRELSISLIKKLCDGLNMPLGTFFSVPLFDEIGQEIR